jgi:endonuclease/exonuclease/phosphatase family metal-dependent hydrolase
MIRFPSARRCCAVLVVAVLLSCQNKPPRIGMPAHFSGPVPDTLTVMSYNVENLFDLVDNGDEYPEFKPNACNWTENTFRIKLANIASVIAEVNPEIAVLIEVENENTVRELCKTLSDRKCPFPYFAIGDQASGSNTRPVILSKLPVLWEKSFGMVPGALRGAPRERPMLEAAVYCGNDTLLVFACHWPSKNNRESMRVERAEMLVKKLEALAPAQDYILAGDFNENYDESETFHTAGLDDSHGETALNHVLGTMLSGPGEGVRYVRPPDFELKQSSGFFDPWVDVSERQRFSEMFEGRRETPDHILLPPSLFDAKGLSYVNGSFYPFTWNGRLIKDGVPYRWQMRYGKRERIHAGEGFSDHLPIVVRIMKAAGRPGLLDTSNQTGTVKQGGFEDGVDGFIGCTKKILVERDTLTPKSGHYCLKLSGTVPSNGCAARARLAIPKDCGPAGSVLSLCLRGTGTINLRCRETGSKKWTYFNGSAFSQALSGKYSTYAFTKWKTVRLPLSSLWQGAAETDFEIRTKKAAALELWIDDAAVVCRK